MGHGVWVWDRDALLNAPDLTLAELLARVPHLVPVRSGDHGSPVGITSLGLGAGQIRLFRDGVEEMPLEGGVMDLAQVGLGGVESVRVERSGSELRIELRSMVASDPRPLTLLEVGTGDLRTNLFRLGFMHPSALGGGLLVALDRMDTEGPLRRESGSVYGSTLRYTNLPREGVSVTLESRSRGLRHPGGAGEPRALERSDLLVRLGWLPTEGLSTDLVLTRSSIKPGSSAQAGADSLLPSSRRGQLQWSARFDQGPVSVSASAGVHQGEGWAANGGSIRLRASDPRWGGLFAQADRQGWKGRAPDDSTGMREVRLGSGAGYGAQLRVWTPEFMGASLFADGHRSSRGRPIPVHDPEQVPDSAPGSGLGSALWVPFAARTSLEAGVRVAGFGAEATASVFRVEADSLFPFGLSFDRRAPVQEGGVRSGGAVSVRLPLDPLLPGVHLSGSGVFLRGEGEGSSPWSYLPEQSWSAAATWYREGFDGRFEAWGDVGIRGREPLPVPPGVLGRSPSGPGGQAPYFQSWYGRVQVRVMTVRVFVLWENLAFREGNADLPGRFQPQTRAIYGIRWTMWN
jgi:hypothetical protein